MARGRGAPWEKAQRWDGSVRDFVRSPGRRKADQVSNQMPILTARPGREMQGDL